MNAGLGAAASPLARAATARPVDAAALRRHAARLMRQPPPWLHVEVARRMSERLALLKRAPERVVDWGAHLGGSAAALARACPDAARIAAEVFVVDRLPGMSRLAASPVQAHGAGPAWWSWRRWLPAAAERGARASARSEHELAEGAADLLWSNMVLHHLADPQVAFERWRRLLEVDGILMFSTLGPGTLETLAALYRDAGWGRAHAPLVDMHDLGDMLVHAGFADPVMDQEIVRLTWATAGEALAELRLLGGNADRARFEGLRTPRWRAALEAALARRARAAPDGRVTLEFEVVYGHAVRPQTRVRVAPETAVSLQELRGMLRGPGGPSRSIEGDSRHDR